MARGVFWMVVAGGVAFLALPLIAARNEDPGVLLSEAEILCLDQKWDEARVTLKAYLVEEPLDPAGHFYLGRTFMFGEEFRPIMAEGEFLTALRLFRDQGGKSPIERYPDAYFEMMCYVEAAKANLVQVDYYVRAGAPLETVQSLVDECAYYAGRARGVMPRAREVKELDEIVRGLRPSRRPWRERMQERDPNVTTTPEFTI